MKKFIRTKDVFTGDAKLVKTQSENCHKIALKCGLKCFRKLSTGGDSAELFIVGPKTGFVKYYFRTLFVNATVFDGVKRLISIITT